MASNFPGPYECRFIYDCTIGTVTFNHVFRLSVDLAADPTPGDAFSTIDANKRDLTTIPLDQAVEAVLAEVVEFYHTSSNFPQVELWKYTASSFVAAYITEYDVVTNDAGLSASTTQNYRQDVWTFRTTAGGRAKLDLRHTGKTSVAKLPYGSMSAAEQAIADELSAADTPWIGRDNGYFFQPLHLLGGQNERMFKDINR